jgi:hypothetical protein
VIGMKLDTLSGNGTGLMFRPAPRFEDTKGPRLEELALTRIADQEGVRQAWGPFVEPGETGQGPAWTEVRGRHP